MITGNKNYKDEVAFYRITSTQTLLICTVKRNGCFTHFEGDEAEADALAFIESHGLVVGNEIYSYFDDDEFAVYDDRTTVYALI